MAKPAAEIRQRKAAASAEPVSDSTNSAEEIKLDLHSSPPHVADLQQHELQRQEQRKFYHLLLLQIALSATYFAILISFLRLDALAAFREKASYFVELQHITSWGRAHASPRDVCYVVTAFACVIGARALFQLFTYGTIALTRKDLSMKTHIRFSEQAWCTFYYSCSSLYGMYLLESQPYGFEAQSLWEGFPHYYIDPQIKQYYLCIFAFWFAQIFIIFLEEPRKDHWQMLTHHFVTCMLVLGSYTYSYTRIGHLVMIMMDFVDIFLSLAKCTKYLKMWGWITDGIFVIFLITWVVLRHFVYMYEMLYGAFWAEPGLIGKCVYRVVDDSALATEVVQCFNPTAHYFFFILALALQVITIMWLVLIVRIVVRVVRGDGAADSRSDSSD